MNPQHKALFDRNENLILECARKHFGKIKTELTKLGGFESVVYKYRLGEHSRILKVTHTERRNADLIQGEIDWVNHLIAISICCVAPVKSTTGEYVITIPVENSQFHLYAWEEAAGAKPSPYGDGPKLWKKWGAVVGSMHQATKSFKPLKPKRQRHNWTEENDSYCLQLLKAEPELERLQDKITKKLKLLPIAEDSYGLVHADLHQGNFFVAEGELVIFDFDDCHYNWFMQDIAIPLFTFLYDPAIPEDKSQEIASEFFKGFMTGYRIQHQISDEWLARLPLFLKQRELVLYLLIQAEEDWESSPWCSRFMKGRREALLQNQPVIEFDPLLPKIC